MSDRNLSLVISLFSIGYILLVFFAPFAANLSWGMNQLSYFEYSHRLLIVVTALLVAALVSAIARMKVSKHWRTIALNLLVPITLLALFYFLRVRTHFLGDGILRIREIEVGSWYLPTEPLGVFFNWLSYQLTSSLFGFTATQAVETFSFISGILFYFAARFSAGTMTADIKHQTLCFSLVFFSGYTLLFCGYAESYSLLPAAIAFFVAVGIRYLKRTGTLAIVLVSYLLLILLHFANFYFAPALVIIAYFAYRDRQKNRLFLSVGTILLSIVLVMLLPRLSPHPVLPFSELLISFSPSSDAYWLFSGQHLADVLNQLLLTAPAALILLLALLLCRRRIISSINRVALLVAAALPGALAFITLLNPRLGYATDWDLFSTSGIVLNVLAVVMVVSLSSVRLPHLSRFLLLAVSILSFVSYAALNADFDRSLKRQVDILTPYGSRGAIGFENIGNYLEDIGDKVNAEKMWKKSAELKPHVRLFYSIGQLLLEQDRFDEAEYYSKLGLKLDSTYSLLNLNMGLIYARQGKLVEGETFFRRALGYSPRDAFLHHNLAICLLQEVRYAEAEIEASEAVRLKPDNAEYLSNLGASLVGQGKHAQAQSYLLKAMRLDPAMPEIYLNLARSYQMSGDPTRARQLLEHFLAQRPERRLDRRFTLLLSEIGSPAADSGGERGRD